jgi:hypothetical protein
LRLITATEQENLADEFDVLFNQVITDDGLRLTGIQDRLDLVEEAKTVLEDSAADVNGKIKLSGRLSALYIQLEKLRPAGAPAVPGSGLARLDNELRNRLSQIKIDVEKKWDDLATADRLSAEADRNAAELVKNTAFTKWNNMVTGVTPATPEQKTNAEKAFKDAEKIHKDFKDIVDGTHKGFFKKEDKSKRAEVAASDKAFSKSNIEKLIANLRVINDPAILPVFDLAELEKIKDFPR